MQSIELLRRELERQITVQARRGKNYHMIVIKTGLGRSEDQIRATNEFKGGIIYV